MKNSALLYLSLLFSLVFISTGAFSQPELLWKVEYSLNRNKAPGYNLQSQNSPQLKFDQEGNLIAVSSFNEEDENDIVLLKYDENGELLWDFIFNGQEELADYVYDFAIDSQNNIILVGETHTKSVFDFDVSYGESELLVIKFSPDGEVLWSFQKPGPLYSLNFATSVSLDDNDDIYILGQSYLQNFADQEIIMLKVSAEGEEAWEDRSNSRIALQAWIVDDIFQLTASNRPDSLIILQYRLDGSPFPPIIVPDIHAFNLPILDQEGNIYIKRTTGKYRITKYAPTGEFLWAFEEPKLLPPNVHADEAQGLTFDDDLNVYLTGRHYGERGPDSIYRNGDLLTVKLSKDGEEIWRDKYIYQGGNSAEIGSDIKLLDDGSALVTGYRSVLSSGAREGILLSLDQDGERKWVIPEMEQSTIVESQYIHSLIKGKYLYTFGWRQPEGKEMRLAIEKFELDLKPSAVKETPIRPLKLYPNPASDFFTIELEEVSSSSFHFELFDLQGRKLLQGSEQTSSRIRLPKQLPTGIYEVRIKHQEEIYVSKILIER